MGLSSIIRLKIKLLTFAEFVEFLKNSTKIVQIWSFFWSVFSHIQTEYEDLFRKFTFFTPNTGKYGPKMFRVWTLFTVVLLRQA